MCVQSPRCASLLAVFLEALLMKLRLEAIAEEAGVSTAATSRTLNDRAGVSPPTRECMPAIARESALGLGPVGRPSLHDPPRTTVRICWRETGIQAARLLTDRSERNMLASSFYLRIGTELLVRRSCGWTPNRQGWSDQWHALHG